MDRAVRMFVSMQIYEFLSKSQLTAAAPLSFLPFTMRNT